MIWDVTGMGAEVCECVDTFTHLVTLSIASDLFMRFDFLPLYAIVMLVVRPCPRFPRMSLPAVGETRLRAIRTSASKNIIALDFDGVVCDSVGESR